LIEPAVWVECDSASSLIMDRGRNGIAAVTANLKLVGGKRPLYRSLTDAPETQFVGIARATKGDVTPARERFCEILRQISRRASKPKSK
jgi:hypothetical protein